MSEILDSQIVDVDDFIDVCDYNFTGHISTVERKRAFITAYRDQGSIYHAAHEVGIDRSTVYKWMRSDPTFVTAVEDCHEDSVDMVETSVFKKAIAGDTLSSIFYLKAHRSKYRDRVTLDVNQVESELTARLTRQIAKSGQPTHPAQLAAKKTGDNSD